MRFREHRGLFDDSMATEVTLDNHADLLAHCRQLLMPYERTFADDALKATPYYPHLDTRNGWSATYIITIDGYGVMGFTDELPK